MRKTSITIAAALAAAGAMTALAQQQKPAVDAARTEAAITAAFPTAPADWRERLVPDDTMKVCSASRNSPSSADATAIQQRAKAAIVYPPDGNFVGDWKKGEALAQSGYGLRFTDYPARSANGGNCYACHQITKAEVSYGTLGPGLFEYGKLRNYRQADIKVLYEKIYDSHSALACSTMPRFGTNKILTVEQIKDAVALLMSPDSPVNKGQ